MKTLVPFLSSQGRRRISVSSLLWRLALPQPSGAAPSVSFMSLGLYLVFMSPLKVLAGIVKSE